MEKINKLMVCGYGEHGKDEACRYIAEKTTLRYKLSTSEMFAEIVFAAVGAHMGYKNVQECWDDRRNHRQLWYEIIVDQNANLRVYHAHLLMTDILNGIRNPAEFKQLLQENIVQLAIWVDASVRKASTISSECKITPDMCHVYIDNNRDLPYLYSQLDSVINRYLRHHALPSPNTRAMVSSPTFGGIAI